MFFLLFPRSFPLRSIFLRFIVFPGNVLRSPSSVNIHQVLVTFYLRGSLRRCCSRCFTRYTAILQYEKDGVPQGMHPLYVFVILVDLYFSVER